jgi:REP element-mobilizing transposase RayT
VDRHWFFTWRTYGSWLPGEEGFVGFYISADGRRVIDNGFRMPATEAIPKLEAYARGIQSGETVLLNVRHAETILPQLQETSTCRRWSIDAVAVMTNHVHIVFGVPRDPDPSKMLHDWKSYATRALNKRHGRPQVRWWADGGSMRILSDHANRLGAIQYVRDQAGALLMWLSDEAVGLVGASTSPDGLPVPNPA